VTAPLLFLLFSLTTPAKAGTAGIQEQYHRTQDTVPRPIGYISDFEHLLTAEEENSLDSLLGAFERRTTIQIAVVTIDSSMTNPGDFDNFVLRIGKVWSVGQPDKRNGIVIGISRYFRKIRIEKDAGIHRILSNGETKELIDSAFIPAFRKGLYYQGTRQGLQALLKKLE
jgi:uncharacterized protein